MFTDLVYTGQVAGEVAGGAGHLGGGDPAGVLPVAGLQAARAPTPRLNLWRIYSYCTLYN